MNIEQLMNATINEASEDLYSDGFYAAIALDLPVKFATWFGSKDQSYKNWAREYIPKWGTATVVADAYKYWIENIFKIE